MVVVSACAAAVVRRFAVRWSEEWNRARCKPCCGYWMAMKPYREHEHCPCRAAAPLMVRDGVLAGALTKVKQLDMGSVVVLECRGWCAGVQ